MRRRRAYTKTLFREQPVLWELWVPDPQTGEQLCVLRSDDSDVSEARALYKSEPVYTPNVELLLDSLQEPLQVVHTVDPAGRRTVHRKVDARYSQGDRCH